MLVVLTSCSSWWSSSKEEELKTPPKLSEVWVKHHLVPCKGWAGQDYCFAVAERPEGPWSLAYDGLQNFYYQWGYSYQLIVTGDSGEATSGQGKRVVKIAKKRPVQIGTEFDFTVDPQLENLGLRNHISMQSGVGKILNGPAFTCLSRGLCDDIERRLESDQKFVVTFAYGVSGVRAVGVEDPATVRQVVSPAPAEPTMTSTTNDVAASIPVAAQTSTAGWKLQVSTSSAATSTTS